MIDRCHQGLAKGGIGFQDQFYETELSVVAVTPPSSSWETPSAQDGEEAKIATTSKITCRRCSSFHPPPIVKFEQQKMKEHQLSTPLNGSTNRPTIRPRSQPINLDWANDLAWSAGIIIAILVLNFVQRWPKFACDWCEVNTGVDDVTINSIEGILWKINKTCCIGHISGNKSDRGWDVTLPQGWHSIAPQKTKIQTWAKY
jgi:hypothetical protein